MIRLENASFAYSAGFQLNEISLDLKRGELLSLVGPNGAGKSTLLKLAAGQITPSDGSVFLGDINLSSPKAKKIAQDLAYLSQTGLLSDLPVEEIVLHGRFPHAAFPHRYGKEDRRLAQIAMEQMGLLSLAKRPLSTLSGGEKQKAMIAMALCQNCQTILMDEPTAFLDPFHRICLMEQLKKLSQSGKSVLCVLHDLPLALRFSDRIAVMEKGRLVSLDSPENTMRSGVLTEVFDIVIERSENGFYYYADRKKDTE